MRRRSSTQCRWPASHSPPASRRSASNSRGPRTITCRPCSQNSQGPTCAGRSGRRRRSTIPCLSRTAGQKPHRDSDDGQHHHHQDGSGEHFDQLWHSSVPRCWRLLASECASQRDAACITAMWLPAGRLIQRANTARTAFFEPFHGQSGLGATPLRHVGRPLFREGTCMTARTTARSTASTVTRTITRTTTG
jgi:hypothetical protein